MWACVPGFAYGPTGVPGAARSVLWAGLLGVPVGGPPASRPRRVVLLVVPLAFRAPDGPAAREIATRELRSEWSISKPARALRCLRHPPYLWSLVC